MKLTISTSFLRLIDKQIFWFFFLISSQVSAVSFAVYSTPWYWSTKARQDLHLFLSQTQKLKNFPIIKMHPLRFNSLTIYLNGVASSVNILLRVRQVVHSRWKLPTFSKGKKSSAFEFWKFLLHIFFSSEITVWRKYDEFFNGIFLLPILLIKSLRCLFDLLVSTYFRKK